MNQSIKDMHKMRKVTIYRATSRELLLGFKMGAGWHENHIQRQLRRDKDPDGYYTMVVYAQAYAYNLYGNDDYQCVRLISGTSGRTEVQELPREWFRRMMQDIQVPYGPDTLDHLDLPVGVTNQLKAQGITGICHLLEYTSREVQKLPGIGKRSYEYIVEGLAKHKLRLNPF